VFFFAEIERIEQWHSEAMARGYSNKDENYLKAGFDEIVNEFGYFYTVCVVAKAYGWTFEYIYSETVSAIYRLGQLQSRINKSEALYSRLKQGKL